VKLFVSYKSDDREKLKPLLDGLHRLKYDVWFDQELAGGQQWWDAILERIRDSDVLLLAVSPAVVESDACDREVQYARGVGKPILPVMIESVRTELLPPDLAEVQIVDFSKPDRDAAFAVAGALQQLPPAKPLPDPLPIAPPVPIGYLGGLAQKIQSPDHLSLDDQLSIVGKLKMGISKPRERDAVIQLIGILRERDDLYYAVARELESIPIPVAQPTKPPDSEQSSPDPAKTPPAPRPDMRPAGAFYSDPLNRHQQRFWSGTAWTGRVRDGGLESFDAMPGPGSSIPQTPARPKPKSSNVALWFIAGGVIAAILLVGGGAVWIASLNTASVTPTPSSQAASPIASPAPVLDPKALMMPSSLIPTIYTQVQDGSITLNNWRGWKRVYQANSSSAPYYWVDVRVFVLRGENPASAVNAGGCDYTFTGETPISTTITAAPAGGAGSKACIYAFSNGGDWVEYITADRYAYVEIGLSRQTATQSDAVDTSASLGIAQLTYLESQAG